MMEKILQWFAPVGQYTLSKLLPMVLLTVLGVLAIQLAMNLLRKGLKKSKLEKAAHTLIRTAIQTVLYVLLALAIASGLGIDVTGVVALASVLTLAVSLSVQDLLANVFGGFTLLYTHPFASEDFVEIAGQSGTVKEIGLTYTKLVTGDNKVVSIPNRAVVAAEIVNYTVTGTRRVDINLEVSYGVATEQVLEIMRNAAKNDAVLENPAPVAVIKEYNATSITYGLMVWCNTADYWDVKFCVNRELSRLCQEAGITFYAPQMKIQLEK